VATTRVVTTPAGAKPILMAWSGGKDSALALHRLLADPQWEVKGLLTTVTSDYDRISIHGVRRSILHTQAERLGLPLVEAAIPAQASNRIYETAFAGALENAAARWPGIGTIAYGDLFLADIRGYREQQLARTGWRGEFPLWGEDTTRLAQRFVSQGFRAILCCVDTQQIDASFCGRAFDEALLGELPPSCDPCGENGEFHTCVYAGPIFRESIALAKGERVLRETRFEFVDLVETTRVDR
jgi:uncharacterized protein (TIGR00290 family)